MIIRRLFLASALSCCIGAVALAQTPATTRIRGIIDSVSGNSMQITSRDGEKLSLALSGQLGVTEIVPAKITDIKSGTYIGTAAVPQSDGTLKALEVQVFPESMRGVGEGDHPWDLQPHSTMTNGTAGDVVGTQGRTLTVNYKGGEKKLVVPEKAPIITYQPGTRAMLTPGAHVIITATKAADGSLTATRIGVGKDRLTPPM